MVQILINSKQIMEKEEVIIKMKKLLVLLILVVGLLGFSTGAFAQLIDVCNECKGAVIGTLDCPQGGQTGCTDTPFNFQTRYGYNGTTTPLTLSQTPYRAIFNICNCETAAISFVETHRIGIRLTLLVNGVAGDNLGAYWANPDPASANIEFGMYAQPADTCALAAYLSLGVNNDLGMPRYFGPGQYYKADGVTPATPENGAACAVPSANRAVTVTTNVDKGYTISPNDVLYKLSRWWIIIPDMRIDSTVLHNGETISVKIETLDQATGGICATCVATCECTIDVAQVCPTGATSTGCLFPYFTSTGTATSASPYWNGIAIVNTGSTAGTATLTVYQKDGKTGTFTTPTVAAGSMYVAALENIGFTGAGLGGLPVFIKVSTTFSSMDGFAMIADAATGESMGYLCRKPNLN